MATSPRQFPRRTSVPTQLVGIDWGNPITRGLVYAYVGGVGIEFVHKRVIERVASPGSAMSRAGRGDVFTAGAQTLSSTLPRSVLSGPCTLLSIADWTSGYSLLVGQLILGDDWYGSNLIIDSNSQLDFVRARSDLVIAYRAVNTDGVDTGLHTYAATHDGNIASSTNMYIDGATSSSSVVSSQAYTASKQPMRVGGYVTGTPTNHKVYMSFAWERVLPLHEIRSMGFGTGNPSQVFLAETRRVPTTDGGIVTVWRANGDVVTTGWVRYPAGGSLASAINETVRDDDTGIRSPGITGTPEPAKFDWQAPVPAGNYQIAVTPDVSSGTATLRVKMYDALGDVVGENTASVDTSLEENTIYVTTTDVSTQFSVEYTT